jgi:AcrR family transcriptional regulator
MLRSRAVLRSTLLGLLDREAFDAISIRDITREAGVGPATFYRHYETKADLLNDIAAHEMEALIDVSYPVLTRTGSHEAALALCHYVQDHKKLWTTLLTGGAAGAMHIAFQNRLRQSPPPPGMHRLEIPLDLRLAVAANGLIGVLSWWLSDGQGFDAEQIANFLCELVIGLG